MGECVLPSTPLDDVTSHAQRGDDPIQRRAELGLSLLDGEKVDVFGGAVDQPVLADRTRAGEGKTGVIASGLQSQTRDTSLLLPICVHTAVRSWGNRRSHRLRTRGSMWRIGQVSMSRSWFVRRHCSATIPSASSAW